MINDNDIDNKIESIRHLKQNKGKSEEELRILAIAGLQKKFFDISNRFINEEEKKEAKSLFGKYIEQYKFDDFTEIEKLGDLVYTKILKNRIEGRFNELANTKIAPHKDLTKQYTDLLDQIAKMEKGLGLFDGDNKEDLSVLQKLRKKFETYINFNKIEHSLTCSHCGKMLLLRKNVKDFKSIKHPFFSGRFYYNHRGMELVKKGKWTKEQYAYVFFSSPQYVEWCLKHENEIIDLENVEDETLESYINNCDYLPNVENEEGKVKRSKKQLKEFEE